LIRCDFVLQLLDMALGGFDFRHGRLKLLRHSLHVRFPVAPFRLECQLDLLAFSPALIQVLNDLCPGR
jgi:hypothetical protein